MLHDLQTSAWCDVDLKADAASADEHRALRRRAWRRRWARMTRRDHVVEHPIVEIDTSRAAQLVLTTEDGSELSLDHGRQLVARVVSSTSESARVSIAGQLLDVATNTQLVPGATITLQVDRGSTAEVRLIMLATDVAARAADARVAAAPAASASTHLSETVARELARAGVAITPSLLHAVARVLEQVGGETESARAVAQLVGRDLALSPLAAQRVSAALDVAGRMGPLLSSIGERAPDVARALPTQPPDTAALRSILAPALDPIEHAIARIVSAMRASDRPTSNASMPLAATNEPELAARPGVAGALTRSDAAQLLPVVAAAAPAIPGASADPRQLTPAQLVRLAGAPPGATPATPASPIPDAPGALPSTAAASSPLHTASDVVRGASGHPQIADAVARLVQLASELSRAQQATPASPRSAVPSSPPLDVRHAPVAGRAEGAAATTSPNQAAAGAVSAAATAAPTHAAPAAPATPADAIRLLLASGGDAPAADALRVLERVSSRELVSLLTSQPENELLRIAGAVLDQLQRLPRGVQQRELVHAMLHDIGKGLEGSNPGTLHALRSALEQVASGDAARGSLATDAARLLGALDGQQLLSRAQTNADAGYVYMQVPMPNGGGAEVLVRRDPSRRSISFDDFDIAFLLDTQTLGSLLIRLEAQPASMRAEIRTSIPEQEAYLADAADGLASVIAREARRPVTVDVGSFTEDPPASLLAAQIGTATPGATEFYV